MRNESRYRQVSSCLVGLVLLVSASSVLAQPATRGLAVIHAKAVDQWDSDVVKLKAARPGALVLSGEGAEAQAALSVVDVFSFVLTGAANVEIDATGPADLTVGLYGEDGTLLAADARSVQALGAGTYHVRVTTGGAYELAVHADR